MTRPGRPADARLVRHTALVIAAQTAAAVAVVAAGVAVLVLLLSQREQRADAERIVRTAASSAQSVTGAPVGVVLLIRDANGQRTVSAGAPPAMASIDVTRLSPGPGTADVAIDPEDPQETTRFLLYTYDRPGQRVVAALDADYLAAEQHALVIALLAAGLGGVVAATAVGWLIGNRAVRPLGHALALQRRFVADASHELRTPLTIVHTRAQVIARRAQVDDRTRADLERLVTDTRVLGDIVNDLLLSAELQHRPEAHELIDLCRLAGDVAESFAPAAEAAGVTLRSEAPHPAVIVAGVPVAIRRAVNALVDNALAHTPTTGTVTVRVSRRDGAAEIAVIDNGEGIHAADAQRLVQRFARAPDAPGRGRRFGLGLALVSEVVEAHGGTLKLSGRPGEGATATITLAAVGDPRR